ncbi:MAG: ABC transporter ATP-binding protein [Chloroflexota bacterium]
MHDRGWWSYIRYDEKQDKPELTRKLLRRVWGYARPYSARVMLMLVTIVASTFLGLVPPLLYRDLIDHTLPAGDMRRLNLLALGMVAIPLATGLLGVWQRYLGASVGEGVIYDLRRALFEHMQRQSLRFFTNPRTGELMSRLNNDVVGAQQAVTSTLVSLVTNTIAAVSTLAIMLSLEWRLTIASVLILPLFWLPSRRIARTLRQITREALTNNAQMNALMQETLNVSGALLVKLFGRAGDEQRRFDERAARVRNVGISQAVVGRWFFLGLSLASAIGTALVFWLGGTFVLQGSFTAGTIVAFGAYLTQLYGPLSSLTNARVEFATSLVSFERVFEVLDLPVEIRERPAAVTLASARGDVGFENVSFSYEEDQRKRGEYQATLGLSNVQRWDHQSLQEDAVAGPVYPRGRSGQVPPNPDEEKADTETAAANDDIEAGRRWALREVSFQIKAGQLAALVGPSGAGKTTLTYLLPRLYDPTAGRILVDGHDIHDLTLQSLSQQIGMVTQETFLFHDTLRANLLYAKPTATQSEIEDACRLANVHDFIASLRDGYLTVVGERGYRLSGGEKQRVAIARVILKDPRILVLDEATSNLDSRSEALIQAALERVMRGRTSLVIAHRLSTILAADVILVVSDGSIVEKGTHAELLAREGLYAALYNTQFRHAVPPTDADAGPSAESIAD